MAQGAVLDKKTLAFVGDCTPIPALAVNAVNGHDITVCVLDNATSLTGSRIPRATLMAEAPAISITRVGGRRLRLHRACEPAHLDASVAAVSEASTTRPSAVLSESPCIQLVKPDAPAVVDAETCTGCKKCITEIGCPGIGFDADARGPRSKQRGQAFVDSSLCNGCGLCVQVCPFDALSMTEPQTDVST